MVEDNKFLELETHLFCKSFRFRFLFSRYEVSSPYQLHMWASCKTKKSPVQSTDSPHRILTRPNWIFKFSFMRRDRSKFSIGISDLKIWKTENNREKESQKFGNILVEARSFEWVQCSMTWCLSITTFVAMSTHFNSWKSPKSNSRLRSDATWRSSSSAGSTLTQSWQVRAPAETKIKGNLKLPEIINHHRIMIVSFWLLVVARRSLYCAWWGRCHSGEERELISCRKWRYRILIKSHIKFSSIAPATHAVIYFLINRRVVFNIKLQCGNLYSRSYM